jgi:YVTN family beta-propeller protein
MISSHRCPRAGFPVAMLLAGTLALCYPAHASVTTSQVVQAADGTAPDGGNLLVNPRGSDGATSAQGWDAVTIPGWQVSAGLPTVVRYATAGFPTTAGGWPASRGRIFAGGAGGTARLVQSLSLRLPSGLPVPAGTSYRLSAWLGGTSSSWAEVVVRFLSTAGHLLGSRTVGPVGRDRHAEFTPRAGSGVLPTGTTAAQVTIVLATSLTNANGPNAPVTGYNWAIAADLSLTVTAPVVRVRSEQHRRHGDAAGHRIRAHGRPDFRRSLLLSHRDGAQRIHRCGSDTYAGQITLINTRTRHVFAPVTVGNYPVAVVVSG